MFRLPDIFEKSTNEHKGILDSLKARGRKKFISLLLRYWKLPSSWSSIERELLEIQ